MRTLLAAALGAALCASQALAQDKQAPEKKAPTAQQQRTDECTRQARERNLQGRERNQFMSACMRGDQPKSK
jgi:opacity protein-like surface antigen